MLRIRFSYGIIRVAIVAVIMVQPGCGFMKLLTARLEKPTFTYKGFKLVEVSQNSVIVNFIFTAHNPNEAGLKNVSCSYELSVEGKKLLTGTDIPLNLNPQGDTEINVPATLTYSDLFPVLVQVMQRMLSGQKTMPVTIEAVFSGRPAIYSEGGKEQLISFETRLSRTVDIPIPEERRHKEQ